MNTLKGKSCWKKICRESCDFFFFFFSPVFAQKVAGIKCHENYKIKMSLRFKITNCWKGGKIRLKKHLIRQQNFVIYDHNSKKILKM